MSKVLIVTPADVAAAIEGLLLFDDDDDDDDVGVDGV
jgi:hypothetical protein